jgi:hypothetical protein
VRESFDRKESELSSAATEERVKEMPGGWVKRGWGHYQTACQE